MTSQGSQPLPGDEAGSDEELIESGAPSARSTEIRRRLGMLVPRSIGRRLVAGIVAATLVLGLMAGFLVGRSYETGMAALGPHAVALSDIVTIPFVPAYNVIEEGVIVFSLAADLLLPDDLLDVGETKVLYGPTRRDIASGLDGLCGNSLALEPIPAPGLNPISSKSFTLDSATLTEQIRPDLGVLAASTLRGSVELARSCGITDAQTVQTEGLAEGIGDEYAAFTVSSLNPTTGQVETSIVILIRVGGRLLEISLAPDGGVEVPDGLARALRIAEIAVTRMLAG